jgi:hypothetical protein
MRPSRSRLVGLVVAATLTVGVGVGISIGDGAHAQVLEPPRPRQGYYFAVGYHLALNHNWEDGESWGLWRGADLTVRFGQLLTRRFGLGLAIHSGGTSGQNQKAAFGGLAVEGHWELARNLSLLGGVGLDIVSLSSQTGGDKTTRGTVGSGYVIGLGYDWFPGHRQSGGWAVSPLVEARFVPGNTATAFIGTVGVQLSYWTGLPRNQLDLPPDEAFKPSK